MLTLGRVAGLCPALWCPPSGRLGASGCAFGGAPEGDRRVHRALGPAWASLIKERKLNRRAAHPQLRPLYWHRLLGRADASRQLAGACASIWPRATDCRSRSCLPRRPEYIGHGAGSRGRGLAGRAARPARADADQQAMVANRPAAAVPDRSYERTECANSGRSPTARRTGQIDLFVRRCRWCKNREF